MPGDLLDDSNSISYIGDDGWEVLCRGQDGGSLDSVRRSLPLRGGDRYRVLAHEPYEEDSQVIRKRVEEPFGWGKTIGGLRKLHHRGVELVDSCFALAMIGYNLVRLKNLLPNFGTA